MDKSNSQPHITHRTWIDGGILYIEFKEEIMLTSVLNAQKEAMALMSEAQERVLPIIVTLVNIGKPQFKLHMADYGKIISAFDFIKHISSIWVVGPTDDVRHLVGVANKIYFSNTLLVVDTLQQAQEAAKSFISSKVPILEKG